MSDNKTTENRAYTVWQNYNGWGWSETWALHGEQPRGARYATVEEAALMGKCIWNRDTTEDRAKLRAMLNPALVTEKVDA